MTLAHDHLGSGPAVLLLHSTVCDRRMWDEQMPALAAAGLHAVRCDFYGFGETGPPTAPYDLAAAAVAVLDGLAVDRFAVVGSSGGGWLGQEIAARWPRRVTKLALLCANAPGFEPGPQRAAFAAEEQALLDAGDVTAATELNVRTWLGPSAGEPARAAVAEMQRLAFDLQLGAADEPLEIEVAWEHATITAPTLLVSGGHDFDDFRQIAETLAARLGDARHVALDWAGHLPSMERPAEINALLTAFLRDGTRER